MLAFTRVVVPQSVTTIPWAPEFNDLRGQSQHLVPISNAGKQLVDYTQDIASMHFVKLTLGRETKGASGTMRQRRRVVRVGDEVWMNERNTVGGA
jgi:hypothetical protein